MENIQRNLFAISALTVTSSLVAAGDSNFTRPNVLLLLADDLGYGELGCYGHEYIQTPVLDSLAQAGIRFTDFHSGNAVSSASRAVLMTGTGSGYNTIRGNSGYNMGDGKTRVALQTEDVTMAEMLKTRGYQTAFVGKWHLENPCDLSTWAYGRGFDYAAQEQWGDAECRPDFVEGTEYINGLQDSLIYDYTKWDCKDAFRTQIAIDYLDEQLDPSKPFFLFMSYRAPHAHEWDIRDNDLYKDRGWPEEERVHAAKITMLDQQIGRLLRKLEDMGLMENTIVLFTSDNGPQFEAHDYEFHHSNGALRGYKRDVFEGGHRVPFIVSWKGQIEGGQVSDFLCGGQDIVPTVAKAAGANLSKKVTGQSLLALLIDGQQPKEKVLYHEMLDSGFSRQSVRMGIWKAVRYGMNHDIRLYDLSTDIGETKNVAAEYPHIVKKMTLMFETMRTENKYFPRKDENLRPRFLETKVRKTHNFDMSWRFKRDDNPQFRSVDYDHKSWRMLDVPHDWSIEEDYAPESHSGGLGGYFNEGIAWYRKDFTVGAKDMHEKQYVVKFDGVFMNSEVWVNGNFLGRRPYGYATFSYDITDYLNYGKDAKNVIAVRVDNSNAQATRWYNGSGIYRHVHLLEMNYTHFSNDGGVSITTPVAEAERAVVHVDYKIIANDLPIELTGLPRKRPFEHKGEEQNLIIRSVVYDATGNEIKRTTEHKVVNMRNKYVTFEQDVEVLNPERWSADSPTMYYLRSEIVYRNTVIDDVVTPFGIRKVVYDKDKGLLVNEQQVKLKGVCLHHDAGSLGAAVPEKVWIYRLQKLREMGCNAIRTSHNPFAPEFYAICDTMGFYVKDEAFDEWKDGWKYNFTENPRGKAKSSYALYFDQWAETDLEDMIRRDRNHPSIIMYGIGNEVPFFQDEKAAELTRELVGICHREDPTRPVSLGDNASDHTMENGVAQEMDVQGYNYIMRQHPDSLYAANRAKMPTMLFLGSETDKNIKYFTAYRDNDYVIGQFIWTGIDYLGESDQTPQRGWQTSLMDMTLEKRWEGYMFDAAWSVTPKVHITASKNRENGIRKNRDAQNWQHESLIKSWNWKGQDSVFIDVFSNCESVELRLNGRRIARKEVDPDTYMAEFDIKYVAGKLEAIARNGSKIVARDVVQTTGAATQICAKAVNGTLRGDRCDVDIVEVTLCDAAERVVPVAENSVAVEVKGGAKFIGMDSGNLFYDGNFKTPERNACRGRLVVYVQSNGKRQDAEIVLKTEGMKPQVVKIKSVK